MLTRQASFLAPATSCFRPTYSCRTCDDEYTRSETVTLVTGGSANPMYIDGNGGIGVALVAALLTSSSSRVLLGSRSIEKGQKPIASLEILKPWSLYKLMPRARTQSTPRRSK
ncbi:hypothetical protein E4T47_00036 [Aureobasidium subglaciale]|nr:hypothetical protein E4T47_00036 [Aureobasidium subglaciale]